MILAMVEEALSHPPKTCLKEKSENLKLTPPKRETAVLQMLVTSREVNEARGGLILAAGRVRSKKKNLENKQTNKKTPHRKHTTKPTSALRPRPPRDGARKTTSHALAHARPLP